MRILSFDVNGYKSLGHINLEDVGPFNILVGKNNSGKSNILDAIHSLFVETKGSLLQNSDLSPQVFSRLEGWKDNLIEFIVQIEINMKDITTAVAKRSQYFERIMEKIGNGPYIATIRRNLHYIDESNINWDTPEIALDSIILVKDHIAQFLFLNRDGDPLQPLIVGELKHDGVTMSLAEGILEIMGISSIRVDLATNIPDHSSGHKFDGLRKSIVPEEITNQFKVWQRKIDDKSRDAVQTIFGKLTSGHSISEWSELARISDIGYDPPLHAVGTGFQHLLILSYALYLNPPLILIEEPERHLHPELIRHVSETLSKYCTENKIQLFITTHSPTFLNIPEQKNIWLISKKVTHSISQKVKTNRGLIRAANTLGVRVSDVCISDSLLFVEGRSDRIVLEKWFEIYSTPLSWPSVYIVEMNGKDQRIKEARTWKPIIEAFPTVKMGWLFDADFEPSEKEVFETIIGSENRVWRLEEGDIEDYYNLTVLKSGILSTLELSASQKRKIKTISRNGRVAKQVEEIVGKSESWKVDVAMYYVDRCRNIPKRAIPVIEEISDFLF